MVLSIGVLTVACSNREELERAQAAVNEATLQATKAVEEAEQARAEAEAMRAEAARAQAEAAARAQATQAVADQASEQAAQAHEVAGRERLTRQKNEAPGKVVVEALGCKCSNGHRITVTCRVRNGAELPVKVALTAFAATGSLDLRSAGAAESPLSLRPGQERIVQIPTKFSGLMECSSCKAAACRAAEVETR